jgi:hypothetical protein
VAAHAARERFERGAAPTRRCSAASSLAGIGVVSDSFRAEYIAAARDARDKVSDRFVPKELVDRVWQMLADYRIEHSKR